MKTEPVEGQFFTEPRIAILFVILSVALFSYPITKIILKSIKERRA
jgi:hypothetical protein